MKYTILLDCFCKTYFISIGRNLCLACLVCMLMAVLERVKKYRSAQMDLVN